MATARAALISLAGEFGETGPAVPEQQAFPSAAPAVDKPPFVGTSFQGGASTIPEVSA